MNPALFHFQYVRESAMNNEVTEADQPLATSEMDEPDLPLDDDGNPLGMFAGPCEFCHQTILPLPTLEMQQINVGLLFLSVTHCVHLSLFFCQIFLSVSLCVHVTVFLSYFPVCQSLCTSVTVFLPSFPVCQSLCTSVTVFISSVFLSVSLCVHLSLFL